MSNPTVSVVIVVRNNKNGLKECFARIRELRTIHDIEVIVIDGQSTDGTTEVINENEDYIHYWVSEPDGGIYDAMNKGIRASTGRYVIMTNSDDYIVPQKFDKVVKRLKQSNVPVLACAAHMTQDGKSRWTRRPRSLDFGLFLRPMPFSHNAVFISRSTYDAIGLYRTDLRLVSDLDLIYRIYYSGIDVETLDYSIVESDLGGASGVMTEQLLEENITIMRDQFPFFDRSEVFQLLKIKSIRGGNIEPIDCGNIAIMIDKAKKFGVDLAAMLKRVIDEAPLPFIRSGLSELIGKLPRSTRLHSEFKPFVPIIKNDTTFVTVGVTTYNCEDTIERTLKSLFLQNWPNYEIVVVDDHSTDETMAKLRALQTRSPIPMRVYRHPQNYGVASARNHIAAKAAGEFVMFCDDDDVSLPSRLRENLNQIESIKDSVAEHVDYTLCFTSRDAIKTSGSTFTVMAAGAEKPVRNDEVRHLALRHHARVSGFKGTYNGEEIQQPFSMGTGVGMYPTELLRSVAFNETFKRLEDIEFAMQAALLHNILITGVKDKLYVQHVTNTKDKKIEITIAFSLLFLSMYCKRLSNRQIGIHEIADRYIEMLPESDKLFASKISRKLSYAADGA